MERGSFGGSILLWYKRNRGANEGTRSFPLDSPFTQQQEFTDIVLLASDRAVPKIDAIENLLAAYAASENGQKKACRDKGLARLGRDELISRINSRRPPPLPPRNQPPDRKTFPLPLTRAMGL